MSSIPRAGTEICTQSGGTPLSVTVGEHRKPGHPVLHFWVEVGLRLMGEPRQAISPVAARPDRRVQG